MFFLLLAMGAAAGIGYALKERGRGAAVSGSPPPTPISLAQQIAQATDDEFWRTTGYRPGRKLNYRDPADAAMIPIWLTIEYAVVMRHLHMYKLLGPSAELRFLESYKARLDHRFAADPSIDKRAAAQMKRMADSSF